MLELLHNVRGAMLEIKSLATLKKRLEEDSIIQSSVIRERIGGSKNTDRYNKVAEYIDLEGLIVDKLNAMRADKLKAFKIISLLPNVNERVVLMERYLNAKSWKAIACELNLSVRHLQNIHRKAILHLNQF